MQQVKHEYVTVLLFVCFIIRFFCRLDKIYMVNSVLWISNNNFTRGRHIEGKQA